MDIRGKWAVGRYRERRYETMKQRIYIRKQCVRVTLKSIENNVMLDDCISTRRKSRCSKIKFTIFLKSKAENIVYLKNGTGTNYYLMLEIEKQ